MSIDAWENPFPASRDSIHVSQIYRTTVSDDIGKNGATVVTLVLPDSIAATLASATTGAATTPLAVDARPVARAIGLALQAAVADGMELP